MGVVANVFCKKNLEALKVISSEATDPCNVVPVPISSVVITIELLQLTVVMDMVFITKYINTQPERICVES